MDHIGGQEAHVIALKHPEIHFKVQDINAAIILSKILP